jgi:predicted  nucleic acid-binding Zn-ribbon protein
MRAPRQVMGGEIEAERGILRLAWRNNGRKLQPEPLSAVCPDEGSKEPRMAYSISDDFRRPVPLALAAVAILGWLLVAYYSSQVSAVQSDMRDELNRAAVQREKMAADLQNLQKASGSLAEVQKQAEDARIALSEATAARAASQNELTDLNKQITDARLTVSGAQEEASAKTRELQAADARAKQAVDQLAALQSQLDAATAERDKALAALASAQGQLADVQRQSDAAAKTLASLQQQTADATRALADLEARIQAATPAPDPAKPQ